MMLYGWFVYPAFTLASEQILRVADAAVARTKSVIEALACADLRGRRPTHL